MSAHRYNWREEPHGTSLTSIVLLLVFVLAAGFLLAMVWFRPWADGVTAPAAEVQVPTATDAAQPAGVTPAPAP